jgi:serine/threonine protein kinase
MVVKMCVALPSLACNPVSSCARQGGLTLGTVLTLLKQAIAALLHLHSLGILHRDLRAGNILIASLDPLHVMVADFGVSHQLSAFASGHAHNGASKMSSMLTGAAALGPLQVREGSQVMSFFTVFCSFCMPHLTFDPGSGALE